MSRLNINKDMTGAIIFLLLGLAFAPSIHANIQQETLDSELVEITTEICGLPGLKPQAVKLTKEKAEELDTLFDEIKERLDKAETREETVEIFNEAIVELDKYGLLGDLSVRQAQQLVTGRFQNQRFMAVLEKMLGRNQYIINSNFLCLIVGKASNTLTLGFISRLVWDAWWEGELPFGVWITSFLIHFLPIKIGGIIYFGYWLMTPDGWYKSPSRGWVFTLGLTGIKLWINSFYGQYRYDPMLLGDYAFLGATGFIGIKIGIGDPYETAYFLGWALRIKLDSAPADVPP